MSTAGAAAAAQQAAINAVRSFGIICTVDPDEFLKVLAHEESPLIVTSVGGIFAAEYRYLVSYKGIAFFTKSTFPLQLPARTEIVQTQKLLIPR